MEDEPTEYSLRPRFLSEYIGQKNVKEHMKVYIQAAKLRGEALDHALLYGPPRLGKTTPAAIIANEMGAHIHVASGPSIEKIGDLAAILSAVEPGDILFIDEIHRIPRIVEESLYTAMEDFKFSVVINRDMNGKAITLNLPPFTLIGATTRAGDLSAPLRERFGITEKLHFYDILSPRERQAPAIRHVPSCENACYAPLSTVFRDSIGHVWHLG